MLADAAVEPAAIKQKHGQYPGAENDEQLALRVPRMPCRIEPPAGKATEDDDRHMPTRQQSRRMTPCKPSFTRQCLNPSRHKTGIQHLP